MTPNFNCWSSHVHMGVHTHTQTHTKFVLVWVDLNRTSRNERKWIKGLLEIASQFRQLNLQRLAEEGVGRARTATQWPQGASLFCCLGLQTIHPCPIRDNTHKKEQSPSKPKFSNHCQSPYQKTEVLYSEETKPQFLNGDGQCEAQYKEGIQAAVMG